MALLLKKKKIPIIHISIYSLKFISSHKIWFNYPIHSIIYFFVCSLEDRLGRYRSAGEMQEQQVRVQPIAKSLDHPPTWQHSYQRLQPKAWPPGRWQSSPAATPSDSLDAPPSGTAYTTTPTLIRLLQPPEKQPALLLAVTPLLLPWTRPRTGSITATIRTWWTDVGCFILIRSCSMVALRMQLLGVIAPTLLLSLETLLQLWSKWAISAHSLGLMERLGEIAGWLINWFTLLASCTSLFHGIVIMSLNLNKLYCNLSWLSFSFAIV